jgi:hypothetical protein
MQTTNSRSSCWSIVICNKILFSGTVPIVWTISLDANLHSPLTQVLDVISWRSEITKFSFPAHSIGGLAARYAIARLYRHPDNASDGNTKGTICGLVGINFITVATPHLGSRGNKQVQLLTVSFQWSVWVICLFTIKMMHEKRWHCIHLLEQL